MLHPFSLVLFNEAPVGSRPILTLCAQTIVERGSRQSGVALIERLRSVMKVPYFLRAALLVFSSAVSAQTYTFGTLAGAPGSVGHADGLARNARFFHPGTMTTDAVGNLYVADAQNVIRKITPAGAVTTLGGAMGEYQFAFPNGLAADTLGNLYVSEYGNYGIRKITPAGSVVTVIDAYSGLVTFARSLAVDRTGTLFATFDNAVVKIAAGGTLTVLAGLFSSPGVGNVVPGVDNSGSADGPGAVARFNKPTSIAIDAMGNLFVADAANDTIRKITPAGAVTTLAGLARTPGSTDGGGANARFNNPTSLAIDSEGNLFVADTGNNTVRMITPAGVVTTIAGLAGSAGSGDGAGAAARFNGPQGIALDSVGTIYVADSENNTIRKISSSGVVTTLAGLAPNSSTGSTDAAGYDARFSAPLGIALGSAGNVIVADTNNNTIRQITAAGVVTTLAGSAGDAGSVDGTSAARFNQPTGVAVDSFGTIYVADRGNHIIRAIAPSGNVRTFAGAAGIAGSADGPVARARFFSPSGVAVDSGGNLLVADTGNHTIRRITPAGSVSTVAGVAGSPGNVDGSAGIARFTEPVGVAVDGGGGVYVADRGNRSIRKIGADGTVSTFAVVPTRARGGIPIPNGLAVDTTGNVYIADSGYHAIRKISPNGTMALISGETGISGMGFYTDGTGRLAFFDTPSGIAVDGAGIVYVADTNNDVIRRGVPTARLVNLSVRGVAGAGANSLIVGFTLGEGTERQQTQTPILVRGIGPTLAAFGVNDVLSDPTLLVTLADGGLIAQNDDWDPALATNPYTMSVGAFPLPTRSKDAAIFSYPSTGSYNVQLGNGSGSATGVALVELYDAGDEANPTRLTNLSCRAAVGTGGNILIAGFVVGSGPNKSVLIRGIGPALAQFGVAGVLANPKIQIFRGAALVAENDNWGGGDGLVSAFDQTGAFALPAGSTDAALLATLLPGAYTVQLSGVGGTSGVGLVEVYEIR
jgi:sugar lactone lactonase YvrE